MSYPLSADLQDVAAEVHEIVTSEHVKEGNWISYNPGSDTPYLHAYIREYPGMRGPGCREAGVLVARAAHPVCVWSSSPHRRDAISALGDESLKFGVQWLDELPQRDIRYPEGWGQWQEF